MDSFSNYYNTIKMPDYTVHFTKQGSGYNARFSYNGRFYDVVLNDEYEYEKTIRLMSKNKITIEEDPARPKFAKISTILMPRYNKRNPVVRIIAILIGLGLIAFSCLLLSQGYREMESKHFTDITSDAGLTCFFLGVIYAGISLIRYAFGRFVYIFLNFLGILVASFGFCELFFVLEAVANKKESIGDGIGSSIVFFLIVFLGIFLIVISHFKKKKAEVIVKRTPILPPQEDIERLYNKILEKSKALALILDKDEKMATYTGSRAGGVPYEDGTKLPPVSPLDGRPLTFIFQINLSEVHADSVLPKSGILEFFIDENADYTKSELKPLYYPSINEMLIGDTKYSKPLRIIPQEIAAVDNYGPYNMEYVFDTAREMGIYLNDDLDYFDLFKNLSGGINEACYLLGPVKLAPPRTEALNLGDRRIDQPLLTLDMDAMIIDELLVNSPDTDYVDMQLYTSTYNINHLEEPIPQDFVTMHSSDFSYYN